MLNLKLSTTALVVGLLTTLTTNPASAKTTISASIGTPVSDLSISAQELKLYGLSAEREVNDNFSVVGSWANTTGKLDGDVFSAGLLYSPIIWKGFTPYAKGSVGYGNLNNTRQDDALVLGAGFGVRYTISNVQLGLGYDYLRAPNVSRFDGTTAEATNLVASIGYKF
jgi:hypothetical protein